MNQTVIPQFRITDVKRSIAFYVDGLGFTIDWEHRFKPGFPVFMQLTREGQTIFLTEHAGDCQVGGAAYFVVPDVDACYREFTSRGVSPNEPPADMPWGPREMVVTDPDRNRLRFATRTTPARDSVGGTAAATQCSDEDGHLSQPDRQAGEGQQDGEDAQEGEHDVPARLSLPGRAAGVDDVLAAGRALLGVFVDVAAAVGAGEGVGGFVVVGPVLVPILFLV